MKIDILASGSGGNCIAIRTGDTCVLVDAGVPKTKIEKQLLEAGIRVNNIDAIFITHAHKDHTKGLPLANKYRIPVWAGEGEWKSITGVDSDLHEIMIPYELVSFGLDTALIDSFQTYHDAYNPLGYVVNDGEQKVSICLDTGKVDSEMLAAMRDSDIYIIEANHDPAMVEASDYPDNVKRRILSDIGHLSNQQTAEALRKLIQGRGERIYLTHLSKKTNLPALAQMTVEAALKQKGFMSGKHYFLEVV